MVKRKLSDCLFTVSKTIGSKKYNVQEEALKLYGEDIHDVIAKFRRTPDYLRILDSKVETLRTRFGDILIQTHFHFDQKLKKKVGDLLGVKKLGLDQSETTQDDFKDTTTNDNEKFFRGPNIRFRRQKGTKTADSSEQDSDSQEQKKRVKILDSYHKLSSTLTLAQRNSMRELGFEYAGHLIHSLIRSMGADDDTEVIISTMHPFGGDTPDSKTTSTTQHVNVHKVTKLPTTPEELTSTLQSAVTNHFVFKRIKK